MTSFAATVNPDGFYLTSAFAAASTDSHGVELLTRSILVGGVLVPHAVIRTEEDGFGLWVLGSLMAIRFAFVRCFPTALEAAVWYRDNLEAEHLADARRYADAPGFRANRPWDVPDFL